MDWIQYFGLLVPMIALFGFLYRELKEWRVESKNEAAEIRKEIREEIKIQTERSEDIRREFQKEFRLHQQRADDLYNIIIDLLKQQATKQQKS